MRASPTSTARPAWRAWARSSAAHSAAMRSSGRMRAACTAMMPDCAARNRLRRAPGGSNRKPYSSSCSATADNHKSFLLTQEPHNARMRLFPGHLRQHVAVKEIAGHSGSSSMKGMARVDFRSLGISRFVPRGIFSISHWPKGISGGDFSRTPSQARQQTAAGRRCAAAPPPPPASEFPTTGPSPRRRSRRGLSRSRSIADVPVESLHWSSID